MTVTPAGLAEVQSRIGAIQARFAVPAAHPAADPSGASFARALSAAATPEPAAAPVAAPALSAATSRLAGAAPAGQPTGTAVVADAKRYLGVPYRWGGTDPATGLDCSGLVQRVYGDLGIQLPRVSQDQARAGRPVASLAQARPGDLVTFGSPATHIGIYAGGGMMVEAPHTGDVVKIAPVGTPTAIRRILPDPPVAAPAATRAATGPYASLFAAAGTRYGVPPALLSAVARAESGDDPTAVSSAGAVGLMQLMPQTARDLGVDPHDPAQAVDGAARLLAGYLRQYGTPELALAAYNAGPGAVARYGGIPPYAETQAYVQRVLAYERGASA